MSHIVCHDFDIHHRYDDGVSIKVISGMALSLHVRETHRGGSLESALMMVVTASGER